MPRDIRSYFTPVATSQKKNSEPGALKPQKRRVISSDEDEKSKSPAKRSKIVRKKATKVSVLSDSDDDIIVKNSKEDLIKSKANNQIVRKKATKVSVLSDSDDDIIVKNSKEDFTKSRTNKKNESKKPCKEISFSELFGKKPIMRIEETKVNQKLQKLESEFHNDDNFDAVLKQLNTSEDIIILDTKEDKNGIENSSNSKNSEAAIKTEIVSNKSKKHDTSVENNQTKMNTNTKKMKKTPSKNKIHSKLISPSKEKLKINKNNSSSNEYLDTYSKYNDDKLKKLNWNNLTINTSKQVSAAKENESIKKQSSERKKIEMDLFEERIEKKKQRAVMYEKYLQRGGARNPGSKEVPIGAPNCLAGVSFLLTGVFDSLERNEAEDLIRKYGGRTVNTVSGKLNYIIVGDEAGPSKLAKANSLGIKQISEDDLLEMIRTRPEGKTEDVKPFITKAKSNAKKILNKSDEDKSLLSKKGKSATTDSYDFSEKINIPPCSPVKISLIPKQTLDVINYSQETISIGSQPLVEKYRPKTMKQIIGQQGDKSCARNLYMWLRDWYKNRQNSKLKNGSKQTHGESFKAALLSGPPGVGKTTTVQVVCKELGYDLVEFNASDTRNKSLLKEEVSGLLSNTTMKDYVTGTKQKTTSKHVLLMDEVDGMAGNEDRGGLQELLTLIKNTEVPIICICNDRFNTRVKTISTHSYDLRFHKLRVEQIRSAMLSLCFKENIKISTEDLNRLIESTNYDIRQVINHLEFLGGRTPHVEATDKKHSNKNFKLGPFDVVKMAFNAEEQRNMSLNDKIGLYFHDYNIAPLFVQENYLSVRSSQVPLLQKLDKIAQAADSISQGDVIEKAMRSNMMWSLLPLHACFSFVIPTNEMSGNLDALVRFPGWFGRNSKATRFNRLIQELTTHTRLVTGANKDALNMDYMVHIRNAIIKPLIDNGTDGIEAAINIMGKYHLTREDLDSMIEISLWPGVRDPTSNLDSKVKAAFTRAYQKNSPMLPYAINSNVTAKKRSLQDDDFIEEENNEEEDDNIEFDKMIKAKKPTASTSKAAVSTKRSDEPAKKRAKKGRDKSK